MRTQVSQYYGRGGARIRMSRPRIESEAWNLNWRTDFSNWPMLARQIPALFLQTRFVNILAVILAIVLFNYWLSSHYHRKIHHNRHKIERERKLKLILQYQAAPQKSPAKPKLQVAEKPEPVPLPPKPVVKKPKPILKPLKPKPVVQLKSTPTPTSKPKSKPVVQPRPKPKPKPKSEPMRKREINLEASLKMDKDFYQPLPASSQRRTRRKKAPAIQEELNLGGIDPKRDAAESSIRRPDRKKRVAGLSASAISMDTEMADKKAYTEDYTLTPKQRVSLPADRKTRTRSAKDRQPDYLQDEDVAVVLPETDKYVYPQAQTTSGKPAMPAAGRTELNMSDKGLSEIQISESGISLIQLKACGPIEKEIKMKLAALVKQKGYRRECTDQTGNYKFYWPSERFTVQHFNVIIYTSQGRIATDRCEELTNACECLEQN